MLIDLPEHGVLDSLIRAFMPAAPVGDPAQARRYLRAHPGFAAARGIGCGGPCVDPNTGLQYLQARWYDPQTAQFMSVDPDVRQTQQPYSYANDDPINGTDPTGLCGGLSSWGSFWSNCGSDAVNGASSAASVVGTFVGNHYGQIAEGLAAGACLTEVVRPITSLALTGGAFGASTYQTVSDQCLSSGQKGAGVLLDALGTVPGVQTAGGETLGLLGDTAGKTAMNTLSGVVGGGAILGGPAVVSAGASGPSPCGCS